MLKNAWLTFTGLALLITLRWLIIEGLVNGPNVKTIFFSLGFVALTSASLVMWKRGNDKAAAGLGSAMAVALVLLGELRLGVYLRDFQHIILLGHAITSLSVLVVSSQLLESQLPKTAPPKTVALTTPPPPSTGTPPPPLVATSENFEAAQVGPSSQGVAPNGWLRVWRILIKIPLVIATFALLLGAGVLIWFLLDSGNDAFSGWGGLGVIIAGFLGAIGLFALIVGNGLLAAAKRKPQLGVALSMIVPVAGLLSLQSLGGIVGLVVAVWSLATLVSGAAVLSGDFPASPAELDPSRVVPQ